MSPILFYDPVERVVATLHPNHTYEKVVFDPWRQETWDLNDTVTQADPRDDADAGDFFRRLPESDYLPTWYARRSGGALGKEEQSAASKAAVHANTPSAAHADALGQTILTVVHNRFIRNGSPVEEKYCTRTDLDVEGNQLSVTDALNRKIMTYAYDLVRNRLHQNSVDGGARWMLNDLLQKAIRGWNQRGFQTRYTYDALRRPTQLFVQHGNTPEILAELSLFGESLVTPEVQNLRGRVNQRYDEAGVAINISFDFKGNLTASSRRLAVQYQQPVDWSPLAALKDPGQIAAAGEPFLQSEIFPTSSTFDALNRIVTATTPDGSVTRPVFNEANLLEQMSVNLRGAATTTPFVTNIDYNAKGQRTLIEYGNGARTAYSYDPETFRITELTTARASDQAVLQDLTYSYDPAGNITSIGDAAQQTIFFRNQVVSANAYYTYDALYRLISATGREHIGQLSSPQTNSDDAPRMNQPLPTDGQAMRNYIENYSYNAVGNILNILHQAMNGSWSRRYAYDESSASPSNNRLTSTSVGALMEPYAYDSHGNMTEMPHLPQMTWDFKDELASTRRQVVNNAPGETTYYVYDASGQRVRKITRSGDGAKRKERIYLSGYEIYREYQYDGSMISLERQTLYVLDDNRRVALVETNTTDAVKSVLRYQFVNHLGSASLELDAGAAIISYEEYYPYGSTSFEAEPGALEVSHRRYRYIEKERDEETGLNYHGARYYAPWLGVWVSCDKSLLALAASSYRSSRNNPINWLDPTGDDDIGALATMHDPKADAERDKRLAEAGEAAGGAFMGLFDYGVGSFIFTTRVFSDPERAASDLIEGVRSLPANVNDTITNWHKLSPYEKGYRVATYGAMAFSFGKSAKAGITKVSESLSSGEGGGGGSAGPGEFAGPPAEPATSPAEPATSPTEPATPPTEPAAPPTEPAAPGQPAKLDPRGTGNNPILPEELVRHRVVTRGRNIPKSVKAKIKATMERRYPGIKRTQYEIAHPPGRPHVLTMEGEETRVFGQLKVLNQAERAKIGAAARAIRRMNKDPDLPPVLRVPIRPPRPWWGKKRDH